MTDVYISRKDVRGSCSTCIHYETRLVFHECKVEKEVKRVHGFWNYLSFLDEPEKENFCMSYTATENKIEDQPHVE